jgi:trehalose 6-phosphate phosphatase
MDAGLGWAKAGADATGAPPLSRSVAVFLDIDGTLVPLAEHPGSVRIDASLRALLERLGDMTSGAIALVSGRSIADIDALFSPSRFPAAGQHGAERRSADGLLHLHPPMQPRVRAAAQEMRQLVQMHPDLLLEDKGASLALHFRRQPNLAGFVESEMRRLLAAVGDAFELQAGKFVLEIKPSGKDKGVAIAEFMAEEPFRGRLPVFVGDDQTDEFGFDLVNEMKGYSVKVGTGPTHARWRLRDACAVRNWLAGIAAGGG